MNPIHWREVYNYLANALEQPAGSRTEWLADVCPDAAIRREVESLLHQETSEVDRLDSLPRALLGQPRGSIGPGFRFGAYEVIRELGRGGMGVVYLADRMDGGFDHRVAVKVLKCGLNDSLMVSRFRTERRILARLIHPSIARLYHGGTTDDGSPFIVMEYVEGERIDRYCDRHRLDLSARLALFGKVCQAVRFAHQNLVVHRDLKPANILITAEGEPKLLDFGIAKLHEPGIEGSATLTLADLRPMTPEYASPEQATFRPITTSTDVYSLGVILYELLTGHRPYRIDSRSSSAEEVRRVISEVVPARPSVAISNPPARRQPRDQESPSEPPVVNSPRGEESRRLGRLLRGDLDNIALMVLAKDPRDRYASVGQLIDDLDRYRRGFPVRARRTSVFYRGRRFLWRNRRALAVTAVVLAGIAVFLVEREIQRTETLRALRRAERVSQFLVEVFESGDPRKNQDGNLPAVALLDRGAERLRQDLGEEPDLQGSMMVTIGRAYQSLGRLEEAESLIRPAVSLKRQALGAEHSDIVDALSALGHVLLGRGELMEAEAAFLEALTLSRRVHKGEDLKIAEQLHNVALLRQTRGDYERARELFREVADIRLRTLDPDHPDLLVSLNDLAMDELESGDSDEAERLLRRVLRARRKVLGNAHPDVASSVNNLAYFLNNQHRAGEAAPLFEEALALHREIFGPEHPDTLNSMNILGEFFLAQGDMERAGPLLRESVARLREHYGDDQQGVGDSMRALATFLYRNGEYQEAADLLRELIARSRRFFGGDHLGIAIPLHTLGLVLLEQRDFAAAEQVLNESLAMFRRLESRDTPRAAGALQGLGSVARRQGDFEQAEARYRHALELRRQAHPDGHWRTGLVLMHWAWLQVDRGLAAEAEELAREARQITRRALPEDHWRRYRVEAVLGAALSQQGRYQEAEPLLSAAYERLQAHLSDRSAEMTDIRSHLVALYEALERPEDAAAYR